MSNEVIDRHSIAGPVERDFLSTVLACPEAISEIRDVVRPEDLHYDAHQRVYRAILRLADSKAMIDAASVNDALRAFGDRDDVPFELLCSLASNGGTSAFLPSYAKRVVSLALARSMSHALVASQGELENMSGSPEEALDRIRDRFDKLSNRVSGSTTVPMSQAVNEVLTDIDARIRGERVSGVLTGFKMLDDCLCGGLAIGHTTILAARPSVGKTSFGLNVARNVAGRGGAVMFASLEQPYRELTERALAAKSHVNGKAIRTGKFAKGEAVDVSKAADGLRGWKFEMTDSAHQTAGQIATAARSVKRKLKGLDLIVVDYLNLVAPDNSKANRNEQIGTSARRLREMGRELGAPVLLLCQLNRMSVADESPSLHHLRDSGEIEQVADVVMFLHRTSVRTYGTAEKIELHIAKQRNGPLDVIMFEHHSSTFTFEECEGFTISE